MVEMFKKLEKAMSKSLRCDKWHLWRGWSTFEKSIGFKVFLFEKFFKFRLRKGVGLGNHKYLTEVICSILIRSEG